MSFVLHSWFGLCDMTQMDHDPNELHEEVVGLAREVVEDPDDADSARRLAELVIALNDHLSDGGHLPEAWTEST